MHRKLQHTIGWLYDSDMQQHMRLMCESAASYKTDQKDHWQLLLWGAKGSNEVEMYTQSAPASAFSLWMG